MGPTATLALSPSRAPHAAWLDIAAGLRGLRRAAVRGGLVGRPPSAVFAGSHLAAAAGLQPVAGGLLLVVDVLRSEEHTSELQSLMRISYAVFRLTKKNLCSREREYRRYVCLVSLNLSGWY